MCLFKLKPGASTIYIEGEDNQDEYEYEADYIDSKTGKRISIERPKPVPVIVQTPEDQPPSTAKEHEPHKGQFHFNRYGSASNTATRESKPIISLHGTAENTVVATPVVEKHHKKHSHSHKHKQEETEEKMAIIATDSEIEKNSLDLATNPEKAKKKVLRKKQISIDPTNSVANREIEAAYEKTSALKVKTSGSITTMDKPNHVSFHAGTKKTTSDEKLAEDVTTLHKTQKKIRGEDSKSSSHKKLATGDQKAQNLPKAMLPKDKSKKQTKVEDVAESTSKAMYPEDKKAPNLPKAMLKQRKTTSKRGAKKTAGVLNTSSSKMAVRPMKTKVAVTNMARIDDETSMTESDSDWDKCVPSKNGIGPNPQVVRRREKVKRNDGGTEDDSSVETTGLHGAGDCGKTFSTSSTNTTGSKLVVRGLRNFVKSRGNGHPPLWVKEFPCKSKFHPDNYLIDWTEGPQSVLRNTDKLNSCGQKGGRCGQCGIYSGDICTDCRKCNMDCSCPKKPNESGLSKGPKLPSGSLLPDFMAQAFGPAWSQTQKVLENGELHSIFEKRNTDPNVVKRNCQVSDPSVLPMFRDCDDEKDGKGKDGGNPMMIPGMMSPYGMPYGGGFFPPAPYPMVAPIMPPMGYMQPSPYFMAPPVAPPMMPPCYFPQQPMGGFAPANYTNNNSQ